MKAITGLVKILFLFPFSLLYGMAVWIRNRLYDNGILRSREYALPVIGVGNITAGGTGKTIHVEYLISILRDQYKVAMLSRGYRRHTSGFLIADEKMDFTHVGDEPCQIKRKFPETVVAVDSNRCRGIEKLLAHDRNIEVVILDDAFQHRRINPGLTILLIDFNRPLEKDYLLPFGRLREQRSERKRADIIIITKVPGHVKPIELRLIEKKVKADSFQKVYFTTLEYNVPLPVFDSRKATLNPFSGNPSVLLVTGIANPQPLKEYVGILSDTVKHIEYPDHYAFDALDMREIVREFEAMPGDNKFIITTEKDAMRFRVFDELDEEIKQRMYYVPVKISFMENQEQAFKNDVFSYVHLNKANNVLHRKIYKSAPDSSSKKENTGLRTGWIDEQYRR